MVLLSFVDKRLVGEVKLSKPNWVIIKMIDHPKNSTVPGANSVFHPVLEGDVDFYVALNEGAIIIPKTTVADAFLIFYISLRPADFLYKLCYRCHFSPFKCHDILLLFVNFNSNVVLMRQMLFENIFRYAWYRESNFSHFCNHFFDWNHPRSENN